MESPHQEAHGFCFGSGMAAITTISQMLKQGDHVIACDDLYGGTVRLFDQIASRFGIETSYSPLKSGDLGKLFVRTPKSSGLKVQPIHFSPFMTSNHSLLKQKNTASSSLLIRPLPHQFYSARSNWAQTSSFIQQPSTSVATVMSSVVV